MTYTKINGRLGEVALTKFPATCPASAICTMRSLPDSKQAPFAQSNYANGGTGKQGASRALE